MNSVQLDKHPFNLNKEQIKWVKDTIKNMTIEEKIGQLFFPVGFTTKEKELQKILDKVKPGGMMYRTSSMKKVVKAHRFLQKNSRIPMFLSANLEAGGNGIIDEGTTFGNNMQVGASNNPEQAYNLGMISTLEGKSVGCNMAFAPVIDINMNFRNPVTNTRAFGDQPDLVAKMGAQYVKAAKENNVAVTIKHFPGDGTDGRDHHLIKTYNHLPYEQWMNTFGHVYRECIQEGARGLMVGHIAFPAYFDQFPEGQEEYQNKPASLNRYLLNDLLRKELGYNGLTMTDATLMTGFGQEGKREELVPLAIANGCDMFLFNRNIFEDFEFMMNGYKKGIITDERLEEALTRILALKASLQLHNKTLNELVPDTLGNPTLEHHKNLAKKLNDESITLVRDNLKVLPLNPKEHKNIGVIYTGNLSAMDAVFNNLPGIKGTLLRSIMKLTNKKSTPAEKLINEFNKNGFNAFEYSFGDIFSIMKDNEKPIEEWAGQFDLFIILSKWEPQSNQTSLQVQYKAMGFDAPWFVKEVPTILVNIANPYQGYDFEMIETVINGYTPKDDIYPSIVEKMIGKSAFKGTSPVSLEFKEFEYKVDKK